MPLGRVDDREKALAAHIGTASSDLTLPGRDLPGLALHGVIHLGRPGLGQMVPRVERLHVGDPLAVGADGLHPVDTEHLEVQGSVAIRDQVHLGVRHTHVDSIGRS